MRAVARASSLSEVFIKLKFPLPEDLFSFSHDGRCKANFEGSRCEHYQLSSFSRDSEEKGMIAAVVIIVLLILVLLGVVIYYICKIKRNGQSQPKPEEYQTVKSSIQPV
ncbi:hypothetical protein cypCar_00031097 [Cyprinus carpio]|nr:hypothetical protein cypCar_00031097 [Cyprinus carpio]